MENIAFTQEEVDRIKKLINEHDELYEIEEWDLDDLDAFREIGMDIIEILREKINSIKI